MTTLVAIEIISNSEQFDVLCGKDSSYSKGIGNQVFRTLIDRYAHTYRITNSKQEKTAITRQIVSTLKDLYGSRFLKPVEGGWTKISDLDARDKVSHALRFKAAAVANCIKGTSRVKHLRTDSTSSDRPRKRPKRASEENGSSSSIDTIFERQQRILGTMAEESILDEFCTGPQALINLLAPIHPLETDSNIFAESSSRSVEREDWESILIEPLYDELDMSDVITLF